MTTKNVQIRSAIRYSEAFKRAVIQELESSGNTVHFLQLKYRIKGMGTIKRWLGQYGQSIRGKVIRVEKPEEINELQRLRRELDRVKLSLADAHVELAVERAYLEVACERMGEAVEVFKKKNAGKRRTMR
jgi:transposase-like protein